MAEGTFLESRQHINELKIKMETSKQRYYIGDFVIEVNEGYS